jgi:hypothetical protein
MKKGEIKRRKRVMPAMSNQTQQPVGSGVESSVSPDPQQSGMQETPYQEGQKMDLPHHGHGGNLLEPPTQSYGPPPVDFTAYSTSMAPSGSGSTTITAYPSATADSRSSRKRTLCAAELQPPTSSQALRHHGNSSPTASRNHIELSSRSSTAHDPAIDPSLSSFTTSAAGGVSLPPTMPTFSGAPAAIPVATVDAVTLASQPSVNGEQLANETKAERKARLKAELDRLQRIVDEMDSENDD